MASIQKEERYAKKSIFKAEEKESIFTGRFGRSHSELLGFLTQLLPFPFHWENTFQIKDFKGRDNSESFIAPWHAEDRIRTNEVIFIKCREDNRITRTWVLTPFLSFEKSHLVSQVVIEGEKILDLPSFDLRRGLENKEILALRFALLAMGSNPLTNISIFSPVIREELIVEIQEDSSFYLHLRVEGQSAPSRIEKKVFEKIENYLSG